MRLAVALALIAAPGWGQEPPTVEEALSGLDGTSVRADGFIAHHFDELWFHLADGRRFAVETAIGRDDLERAESCELNEFLKPVCPAKILGALRVKGDYFEVLVEEIEFLE